MHVHMPPTRWGVAGAQLVHSLGLGPLHVTQLASQYPHEEAEAA